MSEIKTKNAVGMIFVAALVTFAYTYWISFHSTIIVDYGVLIDRTWRIFNGLLPGKDFYCPSTPLTYMIQALVFKIFSPKVFWMKMYLAAQMASLVIVTGLFLWKILKVDAWALAAGLALAVVWQPGSQLMIPWYDVDGLYFAFITVAGLAMAAERKNSSGFWIWSALAGISSSLSFLSKQNIGGAAVIGSAAFILCQPFGVKGRIKFIAGYSLGFIIPAAMMAGYFQAHHGLHEALDWFFVRATQRHGDGHLFQAMFGSLITILTGKLNHFLKFLLIYYAWAVISAWNEYRRDPASSIRLGTAVFCVLAMGITLLHFFGLYYPIHQSYSALIGGLLLTAPAYRGKSWLENLKKPSFLFLNASLALIIFWGGSMRWRQQYKPSLMKYTVDNPRLKGMYFRREDYEVVQGLLDFEKKIPKDEKIMLMPDPLFFYFAADRLSPVPMTHFLVSGWELNSKEQKLIPELLVRENVKWIFVGKEDGFDTGFLRFYLEGTWEEAVKNNTAMMSRSDYSAERAFIDQNYAPVSGTVGFWVLRRKKD